MDYSEVYRHYLSQSISSLEVTAKDEIPLIKQQIASLTNNKDKALEVIFDLITIFSDLYGQSDRIFIQNILQVNDDFIKSLIRHQDASPTREKMDALVRMCAYDVKQGSGALKDYLAVLALCLASVKGHLSTLDKERYVLLKEGWERYF